MHKCPTCEKRWPDDREGCQVFTECPGECWAWTDDRDWEKKIIAQMKRIYGADAVNKQIYAKRKRAVKLNA